MSEISSLKTLYANTFLPGVNKDIADSINQMKASKYKSYFSIDKDIIKELYYDTIRLGYVQLFHKLENFNKELIRMSNLLFSKGENTSIEAFYKNNYQIDILKNWKQNFICEKINWICNRVKHSDGFPDKYPDEISKIIYPENKRIKIEKEQFIDDIDLIQKFYITLMQIVFALGSYKMIIGNFKVDAEFISDDLRNQMCQFENSIQSLLDFYRN